MKVTTRMILACMCMIVVVFARNTKEEAIVIGQGTATEIDEKEKQIQAKADYYDRLHQSYDAAHGGSSIENWTDFVELLFSGRKSHSADQIQAKNLLVDIDQKKEKKKKNEIAADTW